MSTKRKSIGKKLRFEIFARDNFTCRYCGSQSDTVPLVIDHITPVCSGGTNDPENLLTACEPCNQGKGGRGLSKAVQTEQHRLALAQEMNEQLKSLEAAKATAKARERLTQEVCNFFCHVRGQKSMDKLTLRILSSFVRQHGAQLVFEWIEIASARLGPGAGDKKVGAYISGIRRVWMEESNAQ